MGIRQFVITNILILLAVMIATATIHAADETNQKPNNKEAKDSFDNTNEISLDEVLAGLQKKYVAIKTMQANFIQEYRSRITKQTNTAKGKLFFVKPKLMRWDYTSSPKRSFRYDGKTFYYIEPEKKRVSKTTTVMQKDLVVALVFLTGKGVLTDHFEVKKIPNKSFEQDIDTNGKIVLELVPKKGEAESIAAMYLLLDPSDYTVTGVVLYDLVGNRNFIRFTNIQYGKKPPKGYFGFKTPKGWHEEEW